MRVTITIQVDYDEATVPDAADLREAILNEVNRVISKGLLAPCDAEVVDNYDVGVA
jgi:hypothetical protein